MAFRHTAKVDALLKRLSGLSTEDIRRAIQERPKYWTLAAARDLLDHSAALQKRELLQSTKAAFAALEILQNLPFDPTTPELIQRGVGLSANSARLLGLLKAAVNLFDSPALYYAPLPPELLRIIAVLRWEQAHYDEAFGLLERARTLFRARRLEAEVTVTEQVLILLHADMGEDDEALQLFKNLGRAEPASHSWLSARTALTAAFCLACRASEESQWAARSALAQGRSFLHLVEEEQERLYLDWLSARALARLGDDPQAECLAALREPFLASLPWINCFHLHLDLMAFRATAGQAMDLLSLEDQLRRRSPSLDEVNVTRAVLGTASNPESLLFPWESASVAGRETRRRFRLLYLPALPLPLIMD